jgi:tetratricopeptide (TPR) repeat protein
MAVKVFVSSPGDLGPERLLVARVCRRIGRSMDVPIQILLWEGGGDVEPGVPAFRPSVTSGGPQAVIDRRVWEELGGYDVYLGMIWQRMGTPTGDYRSGTEAEYRSAVQWHKETGRPSSILFYRKMTDPPMSEIDPEQLRRALEFVGELESTAGLVQRFSNQNELEEHLHSHIPEGVRKVMPAVPRVVTVSSGAVPGTTSTRSIETDERLALVPPTVAAELRAAASDAYDEAERLLRRLADETSTPALIVSRLMAERPGWLTNVGTEHLWAAVSEFAHAHGFRTAASDAFVEAAGMGGADAPKWMARAAHEAAAADLAERSQELLEVARTLTAGFRHPFVELVEAAIEEDLLAVIEAAENIEDELLAKTMRAAAFVWLGRLDDAMAAYEELRENHPDSSGAALGIAKVLLLRLKEGTSENRVADLERARELALNARNLRRRWRGDSVEATAVAVVAASEARDHSGALVIALPPPEGEATDAEASHQEVLLRASYAALNVGRPQLGLALAERVEHPVERALVEAACFESIPNSVDLAKKAYERALEAATDQGQRIQAYYGLAHMGEWPLPGLEEIAAEDPEEADLIIAASEAARDDLDAAVRRLRRWKASRRALETLVDVYGRAERIDAAVAALRDGVRRHNDPMLLARAARMLAGVGRYEEAETEAKAAMEAVPAQSRQHRALRMLRIELSALRSDWPTVEQLARAGIGEEDDDDVRWALVVALYNQRDLDEALRVMTRAPELEPRDEREALLAVSLYGQGPHSPEDVRTVLRLAEHYKESEQVNAAAFMTALEMSRDVELPANVVGQVRTLANEFFERFPESTSLFRIEFDDPHTLVDRLEEYLAPGVEEYEGTLNKVVIGSLPYGFLAAVAGRPYAEALIKQAAGFLPVATTDESIAALEREAASTALGGVVVAETSALHVLGLLGLDPDPLLAEFDRVLVPADALDDAVAASGSLGLRSTGTMSWDARQEKPVLIEIEEQQAEAWAQAAERLVGRLRACEVVLSSSAEDPESSTLDAARPWLDPIELARERTVPLYSDDFVLRHAARSEGVAAFGTTSLLTVLLDVGWISAEDLGQAMMNLRRNRAVDLPFEEGQILALAAENGWQPGPASFALIRPALWRDPQPVLTLYRRCIAGILGTNEALLPQWCSAATVGYGRSVPPVMATHAAGAVLAFTITTASMLSGELKPELFAPVLEASRVASQAIGAGDPLLAAAEALRDGLETIFGPSNAAQAFAKLVGGLSPADRDTALRIYLRPSRP